MKIKTIAAILLGAATLAAAPLLPVTRNVWQDNTVVAEAADSIDGYAVVDQVMYALYRASNNVLHAEALTCYANASSFSIPASVSNNGNTYPVTKIASGAFANKTTLGTVNCSNASNLTTVCENAFFASSVTTVTFGSSVTIQKYAFAGCNNLASVRFNNSSASVIINQNAFSCASYLKNVYFSCKSATLNSYAFDQCRSLTNVYFYSAVQKIAIGSHGLSDLQSLSNVSISNPNVNMGLSSYAFANTRLSSISLPKSVTSIPAYCFYNCQHLTGFKIPSTITSINSYAFKYAKLSSEFTIPANVTTIYESAFAYLYGVKNFKVEAGNKNFKVSGGGLYTSDLKRLICYPPESTNTFVVIPASTIPNGTIANNPYINMLNIQKFSRRSSDTSDFPGLTSLRSVIIPSSEYNNKTGQQLFGLYDSLLGTINEINGFRIVEVPYDSEPSFNEKYKSYIIANFDTFENDYHAYFMQEYVDMMASYVVNKVTTSSMSPVQKAVRLHQWICQRTTYNPKTIENEDYYDPKDHTEASVFLHMDTYKGKKENVTVCEGYARCYRRLMNKAGIETHYVSGGYRDSNDKYHGHAWNIVKINGKWYHVDVTWDDQEFDERYDGFSKTRRYTHFLCPDAIINQGHGVFDWASEENPNLKKGANVATDYNYYKLGDVNNDSAYNSKDQNVFDNIANGTTPSSMQKIRGDLNFDGKVNSTDRSLFNQYINSYKNTYSRPALWRFTTLEK